MTMLQDSVPSSQTSQTGAPHVAPSRPWVGIAIPAYRAAGTLEATLRSCIAQTEPRWIAYVMVDGADATEEARIAERLGDPRIVVECNGRQVGQFGNFNRAVLRCYAAGAEWIKTLCADDVMHSDALERMLATAQRSKACGLVYGYYNGIDEAGRVTVLADVTRVPTRVMNGREFLRRAFAHSLFNVIGGPSSVMFRADAVERCGLFDDRLNYSGEASLWYRILSRYDVGIVGDRPILNYRFHGNSITGRGKTTPAKFEQPIDIAREIAAQYAPLSGEWWAANWISGEVVASNLITGLALTRAGQIQTAGRGVAVSLRRLTPVGLASLVWHLPGKLTRTLLGRPALGPSDLAPRPTDQAFRSA